MRRQTVKYYLVLRIVQVASMSKLYGITVCYCEPEVLAHGLIRFAKTAGAVPDKYILTDNLWPKDSEANSAMIRKLSPIVNAEVIQAKINQGGAGGFNLALQHLFDQVGLKDEDLIIGMDPDSNPITQDWLKVMVETMQAGPQLDSLSLMHEHIVQREWEVEFIGGHRVAFLPRPEMKNVTIWRLGSIRDGLKQKGFYGFTEILMWAPRKHGYLYDFRETLCPIQHPVEYNDWKRIHAFDGYAGNFDEYLEDLKK